MSLVWRWVLVGLAAYALGSFAWIFTHSESDSTPAADVAAFGVWVAIVFWVPVIYIARNVSPGRRRAGPGPNTGPSSAVQPAGAEPRAGGRG